jgi:hypothetical protein
VPWSQSEQLPPQVKRPCLSATSVPTRSIRHLLPGSPQPFLLLQTKVSRRVTFAERKRSASTAENSRAPMAFRVSSAMPRAPTVPGFGGTITRLPVSRATAAARASDAKGMPWQNTTWPTEREPFTRFR